jgi:hypothetical protein
MTRSQLKPLALMAAVTALSIVALASTEHPRQADLGPQQQDFARRPTVAIDATSLRIREQDGFAAYFDDGTAFRRMHPLPFGARSTFRLRPTGSGTHTIERMPFDFEACAVVLQAGIPARRPSVRAEWFSTSLAVAFPIGGQTHQSLHVSFGGAVAFGSQPSTLYGVGATSSILNQPLIGLVGLPLEFGPDASIFKCTQADHTTITWQHVRDRGRDNTFQVRLHANGDVILSYQDLGTEGGIAGYSSGEPLAPVALQSFEELPTTGAAVTRVTAVRLARVGSSVMRVTLQTAGPLPRPGDASYEFGVDIRGVRAISLISEVGNSQMRSVGFPNQFPPLGFAAPGVGATATVTGNTIAFDLPLQLLSAYLSATHWKVVSPGQEYSETPSLPVAVAVPDESWPSTEGQVVTRESRAAVYTAPEWDYWLLRQAIAQRLGAAADPIENIIIIPDAAENTSALGSAFAKQPRTAIQGIGSGFYPDDQGCQCHYGLMLSPVPSLAGWAVNYPLFTSELLSHELLHNYALFANFSDGGTANSSWRLDVGDCSVPAHPVAGLVNESMFQPAGASAPTVSVLGGTTAAGVSSAEAFGFSRIEMYLMGLASPAEVSTMSILSGGVVQRQVTVEQVIAVNGSRLPGYTGSPVTFRLPVFLAIRPGRSLSTETLTSAGSLLASWRTRFGQETGGRGVVDNSMSVLPSAPLGVSATPGPGSALVSFSAPASDGGSPVTGYEVTASPGGATATGAASPIRISGMPGGVTYTFAVRATTAVGAGAPATATAQVPVPPALTPSPARLQFGATKNGADGALVSVTPAQTVTVSFAGSPTPVWTASANQPWVQVTGGSGTGAGWFSVGIINPSNVLAGSTSLTATVTLSATNAGTTASIPIELDVRQQTGTTASPIGQVDTPVQNSTDVVGAIGVTGWALDDVGVANVKIYRSCLGIDNPLSCQTILGQSVVFVGEAAFLPEARPDVEAAFPWYPNGIAAGWGMQILTNMLPHIPNSQLYGGQGALTLFVYATDLEGNVRLLGRSSNPFDSTYATPTFITMGNDTIAKPFGTIDTPALGGTISGTIANFGWVLTPDANTTAGDPGDILMATNGSGMVVYIDGIATSLVAYNQCRGTVGNPPGAGVFCNDDIANIFGNPTPQATLTERTSNPTRFRNLDATRSAIGAYVMNTTLLTNGRHQIAWGVADSATRGEGIGSRFFTVLNAGADQLREAGEMSSEAKFGTTSAKFASELISITEGVYGRTGYALDHAWKAMHANEAGGYTVRLPESGRLELWLGEPVDAGYLVANGTLRPLPLGSTLAGSYFAWMPPVGYVGPYTLAFVRGNERIDVTVTVAPVAPTPAGEAEVRMHLDAARLRQPSTTAQVAPSSVEGQGYGEATTLIDVVGWAFDPKASIGSGIGAVHVWAKRVNAPGVLGSWSPGVPGAATPVFLGSAELNVARPDVSFAHPGASGHAGYQLTTPLGAGTWELTAYVWNDRTARWEDARTRTVIVR